MFTVRHFILLFLLFHTNGASASGIIAGTIVKPHSRRYMVSLQVQGRHVCGGMLVRQDFVLTAAHCKREGLVAVLGAHNISKREETQQRIPVAQYYPHHKFQNGKYPYDIMLLKLKTNAKLDQNVKIVGLPKKQGKIPANIKCSVAGWGRTDPKSPPSDVLREVTVKIQFSEECKYIWQENFLSNQMICTHFNKKKGGPCEGDSGGPLICNTKPQGLFAFTVAGECDNPKYPHVYMNIPFFVTWIKNVMTQEKPVA